MPPETFATPSDVIFEGVVFPTCQLLKSHVQQWSIAEHFSFNTPRKDNQYVYYVCRDTTCSWTVKGRLNSELAWEVYEVESAHTCLGSGQVSRLVANTQGWVSETHQATSLPLQLMRMVD